MSSKISALTETTIGLEDFIPIERSGTNLKINIKESIDERINSNSSSVNITGGTIRGVTSPLEVGAIASGVSINPGINIGITRTLNSANAHGFSEISQITASVFTSVTGDASTNVITATGSSFVNGDIVTFSSITGGSSLVVRTAYYVRQVSGESFKLATANSDGTIVDFTTNITNGTIGYRYGYNSFDALVNIGLSGTGIFDHYAGFQSRPIFNCNYAGLNCYGYWSSPTITAGCSNTQYSHIYIADAGGSGGLDYQRGIVIETLSKGTYTASIISSGTGTRMLHAGPAVFGSSSYGSLNAAAILQADSTTKGFLPPRMTAIQKNAISSPPEGLVVYDTTLRKLCVYTTAWETITSV